MAGDGEKWDWDRIRPGNTARTPMGRPAIQTMLTFHTVHPPES